MAVRLLRCLLVCQHNRWLDDMEFLANILEEIFKAIALNVLGSSHGLLALLMVVGLVVAIVVIHAIVKRLK